MRKAIHTGLLLSTLVAHLPAASANEFTEALTGGTAFADFRLRYENVEQDNALQNADSLTLRTRLGYKTGAVNGFSALIEFEDSRIVGGIDDYSVPVTGFNPGVFSVIADPETTELDQGLIQYKGEKFTGKFGRHVLTYDNHRFIGHVGWRQDRQTFDGFTGSITPSEKLKLNFSHITKRNRIFAEAADLSSKDNLINVSYKTPIGTLTGYAYLLEIDNNTDNALDTTGLRLTGSADKFLYTLEFATQDFETATADNSADYLFLEGGVKLETVTIKLGYESLGSDNGLFGFSTPLATLHKFNGWADLFLATPAQGLIDTYVSVAGKLAGGKWALIFHNFEADESTATIDDFGDEFDAVYSKKFGGNYSAGVKYAMYSAGDTATNRVDTDKLWLWVGAKF